MLLRADPQEKVLGLTREVCALKLAHEQLLAALARARHKQDTAVTHAATLHQLVQQLEARLERATAAPHPTAETAPDWSPDLYPPAPGEESGPWSVAELTARVAVKSQEVFALQDEGLQLRQRVAQLEADLAEAHTQRAASVATAGRQREQAEAAAQGAAEEAAARRREELKKVQQEREADARGHRQERAALQQEKVGSRPHGREKPLAERRESKVVFREQFVQ